MKRWLMAVSIAVVALQSSAVTAQDDSAADAENNAIAAADALEKANKLASRGAYADAIPYYQKALRLDGINQPLAYYNLAEVQKVRGNCPAAVIAFQLYASVSGSDEARKEADAGMKGCNAAKWTTLELQVDGLSNGEVFIDGVMAAPDGHFGPLLMPRREYEVLFRAADHHEESKTVTLGAEPVVVKQKLRKMTFFGTVVVNSPVPGARIRIFEGPSDQTEVLLDTKAPMKKPLKLREGRHFIEVTAKDHNRWIRNVTIGRDFETKVDANLQRSIPEEIR